MAVAFQPSLLDDLGTDETPGVGSLAGMRRTALSAGAWVDVLPGWFRGADELFAFLVEQVPWRAERREMYERVVDVPRLVCGYGIGEELPHPALPRRGTR